jgi:hypothetical protein
VLLPITTDVLVEEARRLGDGDHRYTSRQLYYAACRAVERPPESATRGFIGLGAVLVVLAGALLWVHSVPLSPVLAGLGVVSLLAAPVNARVERARARRRAQGSRTLATSYTGFCAGPLEEAQRSRPEEFGALVAGTPPPARAPTLPELTVAGGRGRAAPLIVCDRGETAELLAANAGRLPEGAAVADLAGLLDGDGDGLPPEVRGRRLVAVHDADPAGCGMPAALRRAGAVDLVDAGLRPPACDAGLHVIEGAPARLPAGIEADLSVPELHWLRSGRRLELATLTPREVVALVLDAVPAVSGEVRSVS